MKDQQQAKAWQAVMEDFEALKSEKQVVIDKDIDLEKKSKQLKSKFEKNKARKEAILSRFNAVEMSQSSLLERVAMAQEKKSSAEQRSELVCSRAGNLEENFSELYSEKVRD